MVRCAGRCGHRPLQGACGNTNRPVLGGIPYAPAVSDRFSIHWRAAAQSQSVPFRDGSLHPARRRERGTMGPPRRPHGIPSSAEDGLGRLGSSRRARRGCFAGCGQREFRPLRRATGGAASGLRDLGCPPPVGKSGRRGILRQGKVWFRRHSGCMARSRTAAMAEKARRAPQTHGWWAALTRKKLSKNF